MDAHFPTPARLPASVPPPPDLVTGPRLAGDGDDGTDSAADRLGGDRAQGRAPLRHLAAGPGAARGRSAPAGTDGRSPADRGQGLARRRVRPAPSLLRAPSEARTGLLRQPADGPADVPRDRRPAVDPLLPRLRAD